MEMFLSINVFRVKKLEAYCDNSKNDFFRNGMCDACIEDFGVHTGCILTTEDFITFSQSVGYGLSTPNPDFEFSEVNPANFISSGASRPTD
jgi:uncharacterized protein (DUF2237 family)|tara:strand:+ start:677 stop:949 length:273 start_codon:yes stop_codon:yes gene_type:complete